MNAQQKRIFEEAADQLSRSLGRMRLQQPTRLLTPDTLAAFERLEARARQFVSKLDSELAAQDDVGESCKGCGKLATIQAYDFGDGVASWWCEPCRRLVKGGGTAADCRRST